MGYKLKLNILVLAVILLTIVSHIDVHAKRLTSSSSGRRSSYTPSSSYRRTSYTKPSNSWSSSGHSSSPSRPSLSHTGLTQLSYSGYNQQANRHPSTNSWSSTRQTQNSAARPSIGWNIPQKQSSAPTHSAPRQPAYNPQYTANKPIAPTNYNQQQSSYNRGSGMYNAPITATKVSSVQSSYPRQQTVGNVNSFKPQTTYNTNANRPIAATNYNRQQSTYNSNLNRNRFNSTGASWGSGIYNAPIQATRVSSVQSSYPRQQVPAGATYYPSTSSLPSGATYHPNGHIPSRATYHAPGHLPAGATYYPSAPVGGGLPTGATYHSPGHLPSGATYYPSHPVSAPVYVPSVSALPAGSTFLPAGSAIPPGAVFVQQPKKSSSGLGFGSGLIAGGLAGGLLGHALTPTHTRYVERDHYGGGYGSGYGGSYSGGAASAPADNKDKVIIINNGPPGSISTSEVGGGTTVINTGNVPTQPAAPQNVPMASSSSYAPLAPINPSYVDNTNYPNSAQNQKPQFPVSNVQQAGPTLNPTYMENSNYPNNANLAAAGGAETGLAAGVAPITVMTQNQVQPSSGSPNMQQTIQTQTSAQSPLQSVGGEQPSKPTEQNNTPAAGGQPQIAPDNIICIPIKVPEPDPNDNTKTTEVEKIACFPSPPEETTTAINSTNTETKNSKIMAADSVAAATPDFVQSYNVPIPTDVSATPVNEVVASGKMLVLESSVTLAPPEVTTPFVIPEGYVALAPLYHSGHVDLLKIPGYRTMY